MYSAVYQFCPYCPQPESASSPDSQNDFATRIAEPVTAFEPPDSFPALTPSASTIVSASAPTGEFDTNAEPFVGNFETRVGGFDRIEAPQSFETRIGGIEISEVIEPVITKPNAMAATEVISHLAETTIAEMPVIDFAPPKPAAPPPPPPTPQVVQAQAATMVSADPIADLPFNTPAMDDRRTIVVADQADAPHSSKGQIVGWMISFSRTPDGEDYRLHSGYNRIGANPVCDIVLEDETVSGSHAIIVYREGRFLVKDDLSRNGTFVNGREISEAHPLQSYDEIRFGNTVMTFVAAQRAS
ncbi:MAG: FHA domain-containing protein [Blastocatellia bacterium]